MQVRLTALVQPYPHRVCAGKAGFSPYDPDIVPLQVAANDAPLALDDHALEPHDAFLDLLRAQAAGDRLTVVMAGKIAEVCVRAGVLSVLGHLPGTTVLVAEDAVSSLPPEIARSIGLPDKAQAMEELRAAGAQVVTTEEVIRRLRQGG